MPAVPSPVAARVSFDVRDMTSDKGQCNWIRGDSNERSQVENARGLSGYRCGRSWQNSPTALGAHAWLIELELLSSHPVISPHLIRL